VTAYARCPGCGDNGDVQHIAACVGSSLTRRLERDARIAREGWKSGALAMMFAVEKQMMRRGQIDWTKLVAFVDAGPT
jgi:hypothetical protein